MVFLFSVLFDVSLGLGFMFCRKTILKLLENAAIEPAPPLNMADDMQKVEFDHFSCFFVRRYQDLIKLPSHCLLFATDYCL